MRNKLKAEQVALDRVSRLEQFAWTVHNELRDINNVYFSDQIPDEFVKLYEETDQISDMLLTNDPELSYDPLKVDEGWDEVIIKQSVRIKKLTERLERLEEIADGLYNAVADSILAQNGSGPEYEAYYRHHYGTYHDRVHDEPGNARPAKVVRGKKQ
jgi:uncharacterized protein (UPF0335 family)